MDGPHNIDWAGCIPFAAMVADRHIKDRPLATRIAEQILVAAMSGGGAAYFAIQVTQAVQAEQIKSLQAQMAATEVRLTEQIRELRAQMYRR